MKLTLDGKTEENEGRKLFAQEIINNNNGEQEIREPTELGEVIKDLNNDTVDSDTRMSGIDMRSRLHHIEISSILAVDTLVSFSFLPISCLPFTRQKKRLSVSLNGAGRDDIIKVVSGKRDLDEKANGMSSLGSKIGGIFTGGKQ